MAQGEFFVERQNWARWPRVLKVNRVTDSGTETRRYVRKGADWEAKDYATRKIVELQTENAKLRELVRDMHKWLWNGADCTECPFAAKCDLNAAFESDIHAHVCLGWSEIHRRMRELGVEVDG